MTSFGERLIELSNRVDQILGYHRADMSKVSSDDIIAHFATWPACEAMLSTAAKKKDRGITLWAGDANCLNDPLEGRALVKFAEDVVSLPPTARTLSQSSPFGGWPHSISHPSVIKAASEDLSRRDWARMLVIARRLYASPRTSATGWYEPRRLLSSQVYLVSFCNDKDRLDLWRAYGDDGKGVCMVMPLRSAAKLVTNTDWTFYRVMYNDQCMRRAWILLEKPLIGVWQESTRLPVVDQPGARKKILDAISSVLHLYKHSQFQTENEIRLVYRGGSAKPRTEKIRDDLRPVLDTSSFFLKGVDCKIILGPKTTDRSRRIASLEVLLRQVFKSNLPEVQISGVPYQ